MDQPEGHKQTINASLDHILANLTSADFPVPKHNSKGPRKIINYEQYHDESDFDDDQHSEMEEQSQLIMRQNEAAADIAEPIMQMMDIKNEATENLVMKPF
jgi:hypothetical protein